MALSRFGVVFVGLIAVACGNDTGPGEPGGSSGSAGSSAGSTSGKGGSAGAAGSAGKASGGSSGSSGGSSGGSTSKAGGAGRGGSAGSSGSAGGGRAGAGGGGGLAGKAGGGGLGGSGSGGDGGAPEEGGAGGDAGGAGMREPGGLSGFEIAVIGSSTAAGEGASSSSRGWVSLLASALEDRVAGSFSSRNLSVGGYTTSNLVPGSSSSGSIDDALDLEPNLVIVALAGSNDLSNGVSTETFLDRLGAIRDAGVDAGIPVFFVSTAPKDLSDDEQQALADWTDEMRDAFGSCWTPDDASYAPCFIDIFDALANSSLGIADEYGSGDGIHLNDAGHARIFEIAEAIVEPYVCSMTACR